jgi:CheY-like chemotaxis protein
MSKMGPIVVIEDDEDDRQLFISAVRDLNIENAIEWFPETASAMDFLINTTASVFLIFCDINLPGSDGLDFKRQIDRNPELRRKSIPFISLDGRQARRHQ